MDRKPLKYAVTLAGTSGETLEDEITNFWRRDFDDDGEGTTQEVAKATVCAWNIFGKDRPYALISIEAH